LGAPPVSESGLTTPTFWTALSNLGVFVSSAPVAYCNLTYFLYNTVYVEEQVPNMSRNPIQVAAGEFQRHIGRYQDMALTQPVAVTRNGRERTVMISAEEYYRLKRRDRQVLALTDFTEADIVALEATRAPESTKDFDHELNR
jgi:PHD/YefM family antitoxin component YafN of YafNO toxin-antitoxin module